MYEIRMPQHPLPFEDGQRFKTLKAIRQAVGDARPHETWVIGQLRRASAYPKSLGPHRSLSRFEGWYMSTRAYIVKV